MKKLLFVLPALLLCSACHKDPDYISGDRIIFGFSYAECAGDCSVLYKLSSQQLLADDCDYCPPTDIPFQRDPLPEDKFNLAAPLLNGIPAGLFDLKEERYACPGCNDGIAYFLEITRDGQTHRFSWDYYFQDVPADFKPYFEQVVAVIEGL